MARYRITLTRNNRLICKSGVHREVLHSGSSFYAELDDCIAVTRFGVYPVATRKKLGPAWNARAVTSRVAGSLPGEDSTEKRERDSAGYTLGAIAPSTGLAISGAGPEL